MKNHTKTHRLYFGKGFEGQRALQHSMPWQTENPDETLLSFEPLFLNDKNMLGIRAVHLDKSGKRRRSEFVHIFGRDELIVIREFLEEVLNTKIHTLR